MAEKDGLDEIEYKRLEGAIGGVEALLVNARPEARVLYENFLSNAKLQLDVLHKRIEAHQEEERQHKQQQAVAHQLAEKETALSREEQRTYATFLEKDFFTKGDSSLLIIFTLTAGTA